MKIELKGIKRNTPGVISEDGELEELVNLRYKDGAFRPIPNRSIVLSELNYTDIYIHTNSGFKHFLGVKSNEEKVFEYNLKGQWTPGTTYIRNDSVIYNGSYWYFSALSTNGAVPGYSESWVIISSFVIDEDIIRVTIPFNTGLYYFADEVPGQNIEKKAEPVFICQINGNATFTQIGNVVNILDADGLKYAVWYDNDYKLIDSNFDGLQTTEELIGKVDLRVTGILNSVNGERDVRFYYSDSSFSIVSGVFLNAEGLWDKAVATEKKDGRLIDFFLACTAIELYDGSYIMHSNPVLCGQSWDQYTRYEGISLPGISTPFNYNSTSKPTFFMNYTTGIVHNASDKYYNKGANSFPVGYQTSITNLTNLKEYPNLSVLWRHNDGDAATPLYAPISANKLQFKINTPIPSKYLPLIKSISVFMTDPVSMYDFTKLDNTYQWAKIGTDGLFSTYPKIRTNEEISKDIENSSVFYKVYEIIPFEDIASDSNTPLQLDTWIDIDLKEKLENLRSQEVLTYDNFSHHQMLPEVQFMYNSKLHLGDMKTFLSRGFPLGNFFTEMGVGQFPNERGIIGGLAYWIEVSIKTGNGLTKVVRYKNRVIGNVNVSDIASFVSYPDSRATKMVIHIEYYAPHLGVDWVTKDFEFKLNAHTTQNFAYAISNNLKPRTAILGIDPLQPVFTHPAEVQREQINSNVCRVSEINNPFVFPVENTYPIGNGEIRAFSTNTIELSVGQAGQFPLYIFTSDGIYALFIGGAEVNYASSRPISREVINNKNVKPVDNGVIFTTDKGVMIISGSQVQDLSEALRGDFLDISNQTTFQKTKSGLTMLQEIVANDKLVQLSTAITTENVLEFIKNAVVGYKYIDKEIWFTNPDKDYSYIFSKGLWTKITQTGTRFINDYPRQLILNGSDLVDIAGETTGDVQTMFITRPLKMGDGFKQMITAVVRGDFKTNISTISEKIVKNGRLYNWYAINNTKGLAPDGWHIPSSAEILELVEYSRNNVGVLSSLFEGNVFNNIIWSQTESTDNSEMAFSIAAIYPPNTIIVGTSTKHGSGAVRCIKNDSTHVSKLIDIDGNEYPTVKIGNQVWITKNLAAKRYNNGDLIGSDFSGIEGAVATYNNDESNVYDTITKTYSNHAGIYIFGSYDGKRWNFLGGHEAKGELKDLGAKVERTDCKYFRIAFVGNISTDSTINYIEIEGKESLLNKKIR